MTAEATVRVLSDEHTMRKPPTHTVYTPAWKSDWDDDTGEIIAGKFLGWLPVGHAWQDDSGEFTFEIHSLPLNHEKTATGFFRSVPVGAPPPPRLTITRDEYLEQQFVTHYGDDP
jgi:hypothetical protein